MLDPMKVSDALRAALEKAPTSRYAIAKETGMSEATLSRFIRGLTPLSGENTDLLARHLGMVLVPSAPTKPATSAPRPHARRRPSRPT